MSNPFWKLQGIVDSRCQLNHLDFFQHSFDKHPYFIYVLFTVVVFFFHPEFLLVNFSVSWKPFRKKKKRSGESSDDFAGWTCDEVGGLQRRCDRGVSRRVGTVVMSWGATGEKFL